MDSTWNEAYSRWIPCGIRGESKDLNFRITDWDIFQMELKTNLTLRLAPIDTAEQLTVACDHLMHALQSTVRSCITRSKPRPDAKR